MPDDAAAVRADWRAEEEAWSRAALERWEHGRGLDDVLRDCMHRGDRVTFTFPSVAWTGGVAAVGVDLARVATGDTSVDVRLSPDAPFVLRVHPGPDEHARNEVALTTFTARLRELDGTAVCIGTSAGLLEGRVRMGRDQVRVARGDDDVAYVPAGSVCWVRPLADD